MVRSGSVCARDIPIWNNSNLACRSGEVMPGSPNVERSGQREGESDARLRGGSGGAGIETAWRAHVIFRWPWLSGGGK